MCPSARDRIPIPILASLARAETAGWPEKRMAAAHFTLNTGARVPSVGLGTYKAAPGVIADVLSAAVKVPALSPHPLFNPSSDLCVLF